MKLFLKTLSQNIIIVLLVLGIVIVVNILSNKFPLRWDLTDDKEYTLSSSTKRVLDRLQDRLTIKLFYSKDLPPLLLPIKQRVYDILEEFKAYSKQNIVIEMVEPDLNEDKEREALALGIVPLQLNVIEKDKREVIKAFMGMALYYQDKKEVIPVVAQVNNLEYMLDLSLLKLTQKDVPKIGIYIGSDKAKYQLIQHMVSQMSKVVEISPETKDLEDMGLSVFLVLDPVDVDKDFLDQWDKLIANGTEVLVFSGNVDVDDSLKVQQVNSGLDNWLADKGIIISDKLLVDPKQNAQAGFMTGYVQVYMAYPFWVKVFHKDLNQKNPITAQLEEILFPWTNVINTFEDKENAWALTELVHSSNFSFLQPENEPDVNPQYMNHMTEMPVLKPFPLSVILNKKGDEKSGKIFVTATHHILQDQIAANVTRVSFWQTMVSHANHQLLLG